MDPSFDQILSGLNNQNGRGTNPLLMPRMDIVQVDGEMGARNLAMGPNSQTLALDHTKNLLVWFIKTDSMGNKETVAGYTLAPYVPEEPPDFHKLKDLLESMSQKLDQQTEAYDVLAKKVQTMEDAFK